LREALRSAALTAGGLEDHDGLRFRIENWDFLLGEVPHPAEKPFTSHGSCIRKCSGVVYSVHIDLQLTSLNILE